MYNVNDVVNKSIFVCYITCELCKQRTPPLIYIQVNTQTMNTQISERIHIPNIPQLVYQL